MPVTMSKKKKGAVPHGDGDTVPAGRKYFIQPHPERPGLSARERKIRKMKQQAKESPKIG